MSIKSRVSQLEKATVSGDRIVFIDAKTSEDFRQQIRALIEGGLDPEGKQFVYAQDPLRQLYDQIKGVSGGLVRNDNASLNHNRPLGEAGK